MLWNVVCFPLHASHCPHSAKADRVAKRGISDLGFELFLMIVGRTCMSCPKGFCNSSMSKWSVCKCKSCTRLTGHGHVRSGVQKSTSRKFGSRGPAIHGVRATTKTAESIADSNLRACVSANAEGQQHMAPAAIPANCTGHHSLAKSKETGLNDESQEPQADESVGTREAAGNVPKSRDAFKPQAIDDEAAAQGMGQNATKGSGQHHGPMISKEVGNANARTMPGEADALEFGMFSTSSFPLPTLRKGKKSCETKKFWVWALHFYDSRGTVDVLAQSEMS